MNVRTVKEFSHQTGQESKAKETLHLVKTWTNKAEQVVRDHPIVTLGGSIIAAYALRQLTSRKGIIVGAFGAGLAIGLALKYVIESERVQRLYEGAQAKIRETFRTGAEDSSTECVEGSEPDQQIVS